MVCKESYCSLVLINKHSIQANSSVFFLVLQMHVSQTSTVADHRRWFALSDPKEPAFQAQCDHDHKDSCDRCDQLASTLCQIESALIAQANNLLPEVNEELTFIVRQAKANIFTWKAHILRSVNQDAARVDVIESLCESSVLVVQDWAMKYLPRKYRENQTDWFGKRGIPWHISVAIRKVSDHLEMLTFALSSRRVHKTAVRSSQ